MSRRNAIIIISAVILLILGGLLFFYFRSANTGGNQPQTAQSNVNPFGNAPGNKPSTGVAGNAAGSGGQTVQIGTSTQVLARLTELYSNPTSGSMFFVNKSNQDVLQFVDRANGNVYQYLPQPQSGQATRLTNTTIPKIEETVWSATGNSLIYRYLENDTDTINSFSGAISISSSTNGGLGQVTGAFLDQNIAELVADPKGDKIFGLKEKSDGSGSSGILSNFDGTGKKQIFDSPVSFWNISWPATSIIAFTTKPTYKDFGYLFFFNTGSYTFSRILGDVAGLSTVTNGDASLVAYSGSENNAFGLSIYDVKNKTDKTITIPTLADKCVWSAKDDTVLYCGVPQTIPPDNYPDAWYQGTESFSDNIWMIDTKSAVATELYQTNPAQGENIDMMDLAMSPDDKYLSFTNKNDLSEWMLAIQ